MRVGEYIPATESVVSCKFKHPRTSLVAWARSHVSLTMNSSNTLKPYILPPRSWLFALVALLSARHWGRLLHSLAAALERGWPKLVDNAVVLERNLRCWRIGATNVFGVVSTSLVSLVAAVYTATASAKSLPEWKVMVCKELAVLLYSWCVSITFLTLLQHVFFKWPTSLRSHSARRTRLHTSRTP